MVPLYRCQQIEPVVNLLGKHFHHVVVSSAFNCRHPIRMRADLITTARVYFAQTQSQIDSWQRNGGILYVLLKRQWDAPTFGPHDAIFFVESPRCVQFLDDACFETRYVAVVFEPPSWTAHEEFVQRRADRKATRRLKSREWSKLARMQQLVAQAPMLNPISLGKLRRVLRAVEQPQLLLSSSPGSPVDAELVVHKLPVVP